MQLAGWIRDALWRAASWRSELTRLVGELVVTTESGGRAFELAEALEYCDPQRPRALAMYLSAWRDGKHAPAMVRARALARELRAHEVLGELALDEHRLTSQPAHLIAAAGSFIDGGMLDRAAAPIQQALDIPSVAADAKALKAIVHREIRDPHREISTYLARAQQQHEAMKSFVHAARLARIANLEQSLQNVLATALRKFPNDETIVGLVEDRLLSRGNAEELLEHYRVRFDAAQGPAQWVDRVRAAATELVARNVQPGLGLRLLRRALEHAYGARLVEIPRHVAMWEMLVGHARDARSTIALSPLIVEAMPLSLGDDDRVYLGALGLEISWRDAHDATAAGPYAAAVAELVPDHPVVRSYVAATRPDLADEFDLDGAELELEAGTTDEIAIVQNVPSTITPSMPIPTIANPIRPAASWTPAAEPAKPPPIPPRRKQPTAAAIDRLRRASKPGVPVVPMKTDAPPRAERTVIPIDIAVALPDGASVRGIVRDLSISGVFIVTQHPMEIGSLVALTFSVPSAKQLVVEESRLRLQAKVVRKTDAGYGLAFVTPAADAVAAIFRLVAESATKV